MELALVAVDEEDDDTPSIPTVQPGLNTEQQAARNNLTPIKHPFAKEDEGAWDHSEYTDPTKGNMTGRSQTSMSSVTSNFTVNSAKNARRKRGKKKPMKFRIYVKDSGRWFELWCYDPPGTTIEDVKFKLFLGTGIRPHCKPTHSTRKTDYADKSHCIAKKSFASCC